MSDPARGVPSSLARLSVAVKGKKKKGSSRITYHFSSPLTYRTVREPNRHTPTPDEATRVHATLSDGRDEAVAARDTLMVSWAETAGLRRIEFRGLTLGQVPGWDVIYELFAEDKPYALDLTVTKGGHPRTVPVIPDLLIRTRSYIENQRAAVTGESKRRYGPDYKEPEEIFISHTTGKRLHLNSISNLFTKAFAAANVEGSIHRMRARFLTNMVEYYYQALAEKHGPDVNPEIVLMKAAEAAGHKDWASLRPYLNLVQMRTLRAEEGGWHAEQRRVAAERELQFNLQRLKRSRIALDFANALEHGDEKSLIEAYSTLGRAITIPAVD